MEISIQSTSALAKQLGLSRWTVSRALNGHAGIRKETANRVREAARQFGFSPSILARGLRSGRTDLVGVCVPDLEDYFLTSKISRLQQAVHASGLHAMLHITDGTLEGERWALERFAAMYCSAVVLIASGLESADPSFAGLRASGVGVVSIDPRHTGQHVVVSTDRAHAMKEAIRWCHMAGHRRVATAGIDPRSTYGRQRIRGIRRGCQECGWTFDQDVLQFVAHDSKGDFSDGAYFASEFLRCCEAPFPPVIALNDRVAVGMIQALRGAGVRVPVDVSVIGYDNADFSAYSDPPLTTIDPRVDILIRRAVAHLLPANGESEPKRILVRPQIIFRQSTADTSDRRQRP